MVIPRLRSNRRWRGWVDAQICFSEVFRLAWHFRAPEPLLSEVVFRFVAKTTLLLLIWLRPREIIQLQ